MSSLEDTQYSKRRGFLIGLPSFDRSIALLEPNKLLPCTGPPAQVLRLHITQSQVSPRNISYHCKYLLSPQIPLSSINSLSLSQKNIQISPLYLPPTKTGNPPSIGKVKLLLLLLSPAPTASKSNSHAIQGITCTAIPSAIFFPKHVLCPP